MKMAWQVAFRVWWSACGLARRQRNFWMFLLVEPLLLSASVYGEGNGVVAVLKTSHVSTRRTETANECGMAIVLPSGWTQMRLGAQYRGVGAFCDAGIIEVLIERLPFDEETRISDLARQIDSEVKTEKLESFGRFSGHGLRKSGVTAEGDRMSFLVFYPDPPAERIAILVICGDPSERQVSELIAVVNSLRA